MSISDNTIDYETILPAMLQDAPEYVKELVARTGQLLHYYFKNGCTKPKTAWKITVEKNPELRYFIEVNMEYQQIYGGVDYMLFDRLFSTRCY